MTQTVFPFINIISCCISISFSLCLLFVLYAFLFLLMRKTEKNCFACIIEHTITELSFRMLINLFFQMDKRNENMFCMFAGKQLYLNDVQISIRTSYCGFSVSIKLYLFQLLASLQLNSIRRAAGQILLLSPEFFL